MQELKEQKCKNCIKNPVNSENDKKKKRRLRKSTINKTLVNKKQMHKKQAKVVNKKNL